MSAVFAGLLNPPACRPGDYVPDPAASAKARAANATRKEAKFPAVPNPWKLTGAEWAVLRTITKTGRSNRAAAGLLFMSDKTLATHLGRAKDKMGAESTTHAILLFDRFIRAPKVDVELLVRFVDGKPTIQMRTPGSEEGTQR